MLKMNFKDGFEFLMRWGMIFKIQFDVKTIENEGFWTKKERKWKRFLGRDEPVCRMLEGDEQFLRNHESGLPVIGQIHKHQKRPAGMLIRLAERKTREQPTCVIERHESGLPDVLTGTPVIGQNRAKPKTAYRK